MKTLNTNAQNDHVIYGFNMIIHRIFILLRLIFFDLRLNIFFMVLISGNLFAQSNDLSLAINNSVKTDNLNNEYTKNSSPSSIPELYIKAYNLKSDTSSDESGIYFYY